MTGGENDLAAKRARNAAMRRTVDGMMEDLRSAKRALSEARGELAEASAEAKSSDGLVSVTVGGDGSVRSVVLDPATFTRTTPDKLAAELTRTIDEARAVMAARSRDILAPLRSARRELSDIIPGAPSLRNVSAASTEPDMPAEAGPHAGTSADEDDDAYFADRARITDGGGW